MTPDCPRDVADTNDLGRSLGWDQAELALDFGERRFDGHAFGSTVLVGPHAVHPCIAAVLKMSPKMAESMTVDGIGKLPMGVERDE